MASDQLGSTSSNTTGRAAVLGGFDFTYHMRRLCTDVVSRLPDLSHIDFARVAVASAQARKRTVHGLYASLTPMRFEGGALVHRQGKRHYTVQRFFDNRGREILYILTFYLPRFMDMDLQGKLTTIFHELWHVSPQFDGDLRRHPGRCYAHSHSQKQYDAHMQQLVRRYLAASPPEGLYAFLNHSFTELRRRYGRIYGVKVPRPKLLPIEGT
jgi:hypothetical protein